MAFFGTIGASDQGPVLRSTRLFLRTPVVSDYASWSQLRGRSRDFLTPWEPNWPEDDLTRSSFRRRLRRYQRDLRGDRSYTFFLFDITSKTLLGGLTLSAIRRGVTQSCSLGYWIGAPYAQQGYMSEAVGAIVPFVFEGLGLHRIEAACLPSNEASIRLLQNAGFTREGYARGYLRIAGKWQDHILFARLAEDSCAQASGAADIHHLQSVVKHPL